MLRERFGDAAFAPQRAGDGRGGQGSARTPQIPPSAGPDVFSTRSLLSCPISPAPTPPQPLLTPAGAGGGIFNAAGEWQPLFFSPVGDGGGDARAGGDLSGWSLAPRVTHKPLWPQWGE